ncbi:DEAD/DEAH box helicase [Alicyclobacillus dauci]|uniref:DNA 3'-5' helicase n=1 Tax=Alicyclobacillus dauci TaxID=1475485 RepID=A0ABY6YX99_9BACL|nr:DEAD/DEAH box helicase [Alicyclobacillus dauci]WAH35080.1 DEAD/DEAH box helicase [Alicyclobacillus dauci]
MNGTEQFKLMGEAIATVYGSLHRITHREIVEHLTTYSRTIGNGHGPPTRRLRRVYQLYEKLKVKLHRWDYDDILLSALEVIKRAQVLPYFDGLEYLLVDEFQDTNDVQWGIVNALHRRFDLPVFVVGDDDQSIYGFRGASPKYLQQGTATFSNAKQYLLTFNFRSDRKIVSHADTFIRHLNDRIEKPLQATSNAAGFVQAYGVTNTLVQTTVVSDILQGIIENSSASVSVAVLARNRRQLYEAWRRYRERVQSGGSPTNRVDVEFRTFHDSKGKEWDVVILLHLSVTHDRDFMSGTDSERRNEERRLFYVAMTRAKFALILFVPFERDGVRTAPLAFLQEANIKITAWDAKDVHRIRETLDR